MPGRPTIAIALRLGANGLQITDEQHARLRACGQVLDPTPLTTFDDARAVRLLGDCEVLLTGWGCPPVDRSVLARAGRLRAVVHAAGSVKGFLSPEVWERGIVVSSAAAANAEPVAEYTLAVILLANKRAFAVGRPALHRPPRVLAWADERPEMGNYDKTIGVVGASRVGRRVIELLAPFALRVVVADPLLAADDAQALGVELMDLDALLSTSDVVTLHAPLLPETTGMISRERLALLRDGATLVNTGRGRLIDRVALEAELTSGRIHAVLDVTDPEPLPADSPLHDLANVFLTPHIAGSLGTETRRLVDHAIAEIERHARGEPFAHPVTHTDLATLA